MGIMKENGVPCPLSAVSNRGSTSTSSAEPDLMKHEHRLQELILGENAENKIHVQSDTHGQLTHVSNTTGACISE